MKTIMVYRGGLPDAPSSELFEVDIDKEDLILSQITLGALKNKVIQTYKIPLKNIVECGCVTEKGTCGSREKRGRPWSQLVGSCSVLPAWSSVD